MGSVLRINIICSSLSIHESECYATILIEWTNENMQDNQNPPKKFQNSLQSVKEVVLKMSANHFQRWMFGLKQTTTYKKWMNLPVFLQIRSNIGLTNWQTIPYFLLLLKKYFVCLLRVLQWSTFLMKIGLIIRSHRGKLSSDMLSIIVYLKRNANMQK